MIPGIGDVNVSASISCYAFGMIKLGAGADTIEAVRDSSYAGKGADCAAGNFANGAAGRISDEKLTGTICGDALRAVETRASAEIIIGAKVSGRTGDGADGAVRRDFANGAVFGVGDINVS